METNVSLLFANKKTIAIHGLVVIFSFIAAAFFYYRGNESLNQTDKLSKKIAQYSALAPSPNVDCEQAFAKWVSSIDKNSLASPSPNLRRLYEEMDRKCSENEVKELTTFAAHVGAASSAKEHSEQNFSAALVSLLIYPLYLGVLFIIWAIKTLTTRR